MNQLTNTAIINSFRIGFNVRFRSKNVLGDNELVGVAFFDRSENLLTHQTFLEFEMESYEQTDVFASPYIFNEFEMIGEYISSLGNQSSTLSKYERCIANLTN